MTPPAARAASASDTAASIVGRLEAVHPETARVSRLAFDARLQRGLHALLQTRMAFGRHVTMATAMVEVEAAEGLFQLVFDSAQWPALDMALAMNDPECSAAVTTELLAPWGQALAPLLGSLRVIRRKRTSAAGAHRAPTTVIGTPQASVGLHRVENRLATHLRAGLAQAPAGALAALGRLRLPGRVVLMVRVLPAAVLSGLAAGDTVLLEPNGQHEPSFRLIYGKGMTMQVPTELQNREKLVAQGAPTLADDALQMPEPNAVDELQVPVSFEIDTARVTLAELASIRPGYVIELDRPVQSAVVRLVCHGQTVGHGQLVAVGEQMGVRILRTGLPAGNSA